MVQAEPFSQSQVITHLWKLTHSGQGHHRRTISMLSIISAMAADPAMRFSADAHVAVNRRQLSRDEARNVARSKLT